VQLGEAVVRLYERYAELLPEGAERERAAATARSVAALPLTGPFDVDRYATALSPAIVAEDSRSVGFGSLEGAEAVLGAVRALDDLSEGAVSRVDDILGLRSDAVLVRWSLSGRLRAGGGTYERPLLELWAFGAAGLATHWVQFDADREEEALARFDEMTAEPAAARAVAGPAAATKKRIRRVLTNAATAVAARLQPAIAARDEDAIARLHGDGVEITDHPLGYVTQRQETLTWWRLFFNDRDAAFRLEPCATLGASLALCHRSWSGSGSGDTDFDIGAFESRGFDLIEVDAKGRVARVDTFATDRLGDAVARLYERYAELLPEGPERARAVATARSVAALPLTGPFDVDRYATALSPAIAAEDSRSVGFGSLEGAEAVLGAVRALDDLSEGAVSRVDDILGLRSDALLVSWSQSGRLRAGGGSYERPLLELWAFGAEGLLARWEQFDVDREDEALSRLDELIADGSSVRASRAVPAAGRVPANAATRWALRLKAAIAERDFDAYSALVADDFEALHHPTGVVFDRRADLSEWPLYFRAKNATLEFDTLATLGDSLALFRRSWSASGVVSHRFDVGPYESDDIILSETDEHGRKRRWEIFATRRLWDAVVRLYERYAELLPEGPARVRAAATACSLRTIAAAEAVDVDRLAPAFAPDIQVVDRRPAGTFFTHGAKQLLEGLRAWHTVGADLVSSVNRVLGVRPDALLVRLNLSGTNRVGGGLFERPTVEIWAFGPDGLIMLVEIFDPDHEQQALARFDELTAEPAATRAVAAPTLAARPRRRRVRPNAATINAARLDAAIATRSADAIPPLFAEDLRGVDHTTEAALERAGLLFSFRALLRAQDPKSWHEPLATLGDSLALFRRSMSASGFSGATLDVGAYEREEVTLIQTDEQGRRCWFETFATSQLKDAVARLYERYAELLPDGPERERAAATARSMAAQLGPIDVEFWTTTFSPIVATDIEVVDRRTLSSFSAHGAQALLDGMRAWLAVAVPVSRSVEDVLASHPSALLVRAIDRFTATEWAGGGDFELHCINLSVFGSDGLLTRLELLDADREDEALARFDELTAELQQTVRPVQRWVARNAATAHFASVDAALTAGDAGALSSLLAEDVEVVDHTSGASYGRTGTLDFWRRQLRVPGLVHRSESLATLGDSLAICRGSISGSGARGEKFDVGAFEFETVVLVEVDARGRRQRLEIFAANRLGDAIARLYACYAEHFARGTQQERAAAIARAIALLVSVAPRDRDAFRTQSHMFLAPGVEHVDRRTVGAGITRGAHAVVRVLDALLELSEGFSTITDDVIALEPGALLTKVTSSGTDRTSGGAFERTYTLLTVFDTDGRVARLEQFDVGREAQALARFLEVTARDDRVSYGHTGGQ
jgi:hypothetical protein